IAHGINMSKGMNQQKLATESGYWPLYRFDPRLRDQGKNPLQIDSKAPKVPLRDYIYNEQRYKLLTQINPRQAKAFEKKSQAIVNEHWLHLQEMAKEPVPEQEEESTNE
ncbi:MAG: hypothetical protein MI700_12385, partial [Balneolales bacterium]|nr:hypothetical protein [Balneolales bacterium]